MNDVQGCFYGAKTVTEYLYPEQIKAASKINNPEKLKEQRALNVSFHCREAVEFSEKGAYVLLDFGKEICGGIRIITVGDPEYCAKLHIRFGESVTEAMTDLGVKNALNAHSPRDFTALVPGLSDLTLGQSGFRFAYIELCSEKPVLIQSILGTNTLPDFPFEAHIITDDGELNKILETAEYTAKLCHQNGVILDGIKRDRLIWIGDLHQEMLTSLYAFGDNGNVRSCIEFARKDTSAHPNQWVNWMAPYSMWWIICLCDYCNISGNYEFFESNAAFAKENISRFNKLVKADGSFDKSDKSFESFLDWPTSKTDDAEIGTAAVLLLAAKKLLHYTQSRDAEDLIFKLTPTLSKAAPASKQANALKALSGAEASDITEKIEKNGSNGFSTFMAYYILKAYRAAGGKNSLELIKEYFGGMLSRGATTFWEDFDIKWLENSGRIDEFTEPNQRDLHADYGNYCYKGLRHSLCHGWSSGVFAFFVEDIMGITIEDGRIIQCNPNMSGLKRIKADLPVADGKIAHIEIEDGKPTISYKNISY